MGQPSKLIWLLIIHYKFKRLLNTKNLASKKCKVAIDKWFICYWLIKSEAAFIIKGLVLNRYILKVGEQRAIIDKRTMIPINLVEN